MKKQILAAAVLLTAAFTLPAYAETRTLFKTVPAQDLTQVNIEAGVGDVEILVGNDSEIHAEVILKPRWGGLFSSRKRAERDVEAASLSSRVVRGTLHLEIDSRSKNRKFEERWTVMIPQTLAVDLEHGVGDAKIRGLAGGVSVEAGVGDVTIESIRGDVVVEVGVGNAKVIAPAKDTGYAECSSGVGSASVRVKGKKHSGSGFVGNSAEWNGKGDSSIEVDVGVGDSVVALK